jgi:hypothetical protein
MASGASAIDALRAPPGLSWNAFRTWYAEHVGKAANATISAAYAEYKGRIEPDVVEQARDVATTLPKSSPAAEARLCKELEVFNGITYDMSGLICTQLARARVSWPEVLEAMKRCLPLEPCTACTRVGYKVARSLIKVAATRVFADPEQSIIEPVANSFDAYAVAAAAASGGVAKKIGKFGLGFFSFIYWVIGHPLRKLAIFSSYDDAPGHRCGYVVTITDVGGVVAFKLETQSGGKAGDPPTFSVHLDTTQDPLDRDTISAFLDQLRKLLYVTGASLSIIATVPKLHTAGSHIVRITNEPATLVEQNRKISVLIGTVGVNVNDHATGVPLPVTLGSVLVPSISTKTIALSPGVAEVGGVGAAPREVGKARIELLRGSSIHDALLVLVGGVGVVDVPAKSIGSLVAGGYEPTAYILDLPASTRVPVSRDDVLPPTLGSPSVLGEAAAALLELAAEKKHDVSVAQELLEAYVARSANPENQAAVRRALVTFYEANIARLVPSGYSSIYNRTRPGFADLVTSLTYDATAVERLLDSRTKPQRDIWYGLAVLVLDDVRTRLRETHGPVTSAGLVSYLFIDAAHQKSLGPGWVKTITSSYFATKLYPVSSSYGQADYDRYDEPVKSLLFLVLSLPPNVRTQKGLSGRQKSVRPSDIIKDPERLRLIFAVLLKLDALTVYFEPDLDGMRMKLLGGLVELALFLPSALSTVCSELLRRFAAFKGNQTYGGNPQRLVPEVHFGEISKSLNILRDPSLSVETVTRRAEAYLIEHMVTTIRAIKEETHTIIRIFNRLSPSGLNNDLFRPRNVRANRGNETEPTPFFAEALRQSASFIELTALCAGSGRGFEISKERIAPSLLRTLPTLISYVLERIRGRRYTSDTLLRWYGWWQILGFRHAELSDPEIIRDTLLTRQWVKAAEKMEQIPMAPGPKPLDTPDASFLLSREVRYLFSHELPNALGLERFLSDVQAAKDLERTPLQIIEIAVNEGTSKPPLEAALTELVQNSLDVIRQLPPDALPEQRIIGVELSRSIDDKSLSLSIVDKVGMVSDAFLYVGIPFLSTKTPSELVTGEIGSGFFNAYRGTTSVSIDSTRGVIRRRSYDTPVKDATGRVVDIHKSFLIETATVMDRARGNLTRITLEIPVVGELDKSATISRIEYAARYVLGLVVAPEVLITYNGEDVSVPKTLVGRVGSFELYLTDEGTRRHDSYLMTKGVPFAPLEPYIKPYLNFVWTRYAASNVLVNVLHGGYTPVQTRTRIRLSPEAERDFKLVVTYATCLTELRAVVAGTADFLLDHINSIADAEQCTFGRAPDIVDSMNRSEQELLKDVALPGVVPLSRLLNACAISMGYGTYNEPKTRERIEAVLRDPQMVNSVFPRVNELVREVARRWLRDKNKGRTERMKQVERDAGGPGNDVPPPKKADYKSIPEPILLRVVTAYVETYWEVARELKVAGIGADAKSLKRPPPAVFTIVSEDPASGWYTPSPVHSITLNFTGTTEAERKAVLSVLALRDQDGIQALLPQSPLWRTFFAHVFPASTLPHELEHARRGVSHAEGNHSSTTERLFDADPPNTQRSFDEASNATLVAVLAAKFYERLFAKKY